MSNIVQVNNKDNRNMSGAPFVNFELIWHFILLLTALVIQIFLLQQRNADTKQLFLYLCQQNPNLHRQFFLLTLD